MLLSDLGAEVIRVDSPHRNGPSQKAISRNRRSIVLDLKSSDGVRVAQKLVDGADVLVEGFRPGVTERLGLGPDECQRRNRGLVYARMTGYGQTGIWSDEAGHDINFAAISGALYPIGRANDTPPPPLNLVADFGGGGTFLALGVVAALLERVTSGLGQTIDVAMVDGAASLTTYTHGLIADGEWNRERASNRLDGAAPYYDTYRTADGKYVAVGASEPKFFHRFLAELGLDSADFPQNDTSRWPSQKRQIQSIFIKHSRDHWEAAFADADACVTPVLEWDELPAHPYHRERGSFLNIDGMKLPAPVPRLSRTPSMSRFEAPQPGQHTDELLTEIGFTRHEIAELRKNGAVA